MMKSFGLIILILVLGFSVQAKEDNNLANMGRGVVNIGSCFLEVPRAMVYRNSEVPFWGFVGGAVEGVGLTALRAFTGVTDIIFLGFDKGLMFNDSTFEEYVWNSDWLPNSDEQEQEINE